MSNTFEQNQIFYDANCSMCVFLAKLLDRMNLKQITVTPDFNHPVNLVVLNSVGERFEGELAWEWLLNHHPGLKALNWIADRLGIRQHQVAKKIQKTTHWIRKKCRTCMGI